MKNKPHNLPLSLWRIDCVCKGRVIWQIKTRVFKTGLN